MKEPVDRVKHLKECVNNLISVLALPAIWTGGEAHQIVTALLDTLLGMLRLDCVYVGLRDAAGLSPIEMIRAAQSGNAAGLMQVINEALKASSKCETCTWPVVLRRPASEEDLSPGSWTDGAGIGNRNRVGGLVAKVMCGGLPRMSRNPT